MSTVRILFPAENKSLQDGQSQQFLGGYSSNAFIDDTVNSFTIPDLLATGFRYFRFSRDEELVQDLKPDTQGLIIDFTSQHHWMAWLIYAGAAALTLLFICYYWTKRKNDIDEEEKKAKQSYNLIKDKLQGSSRGLSDASINPAPNTRKFIENVEELNYCFEEMLRAGETIYDQGSRIEKDPENSNVTFFLKKKPTWSLINITFPLWTALGAYAFFYWLEWLWRGLLDVSILSIGFQGTAAIVAYSLPILPSVLYLSYKLYRWYIYQVKPEHDPTTKDMQDVIQLQQELERKVEIKNAIEKFNLSNDDIKDIKPFSLSRASIGYTGYLNACANGLVTAVGAYGLGHYILWPFGELVPCLISNLYLLNIFSLGIFFLGVGYGIWSAKNRANELAENQINNEVLEKECEEKLALFSTSVGEILPARLSTEVKAPKLEVPNNSIYDVINKVNKNDVFQALVLSMSGGYIARLFVFTKTSMFLPSFINFTAGAALLSGLWPYAIVIAATLAWGIFRLQLSKQKQKELDNKHNLQAQKERRAELIHLMHIADIHLVNKERSKQLSHTCPNKNQGVVSYRLWTPLKTNPTINKLPHTGSDLKPILTRV